MAARPVVLVTGGTGFIGSFMTLRLLELDYDTIVVDNLYNSSAKVLDRIELICGKRPTFYQADIVDKPKMLEIFTTHKIDVVIHFAGLKSVGESVAEPLRYFTNNLTGTFNLLEAMLAGACKRIVFSSSCTVYGQGTPPLTEDQPFGPQSPYGRTKAILEGVLQDMAVAHKDMSAVCLRYFNPCGAHPSGLLGEDPRGAPANLVPIVTQVAIGKRKSVSVLGTDYPTPDGTGVRDYIHVLDLIDGHLAAMARQLAADGFVGCHAYNLGTGRGSSVLEVIAAMELASGKTIARELCPRRPGDVASAYCDPAKVARDLGWVGARTLDQMCADSWKWWLGNPEGYDSPVPTLDK